MTNYSNPFAVTATLTLSAAALALFGATPALAEEASTTLAVSATVTANCTVSTTPVAFGDVNTLSASDVEATGGVTVSCTNGTAWAASANAGSGSGASLLERRMTSGANALRYALYTDAARTSIWGDGSGSTAMLTDTGTGTAQSLTIYGRVPAGQTSVPAGSYTDTVLVTVTY